MVNIKKNINELHIILQISGNGPNSKPFALHCYVRETLVFRADYMICEICEISALVHSTQGLCTA